MSFKFFTYMFELLHIKSRRRCECNQCEALYVIATISCVCNQAEEIHLAVITYTLKRDYIPLTQITYQAFGLDKRKHRFCDAFFLARSKGFEPPFFRIGICCVIQLRHERK